MPTNFLSLPSELRNIIYELDLTRCYTNGKRHHCWCPHEIHTNPIPGLFFVNKRISLEASSVFYAAICFDLSIYHMPELVEFLERRGRQNTSFISRIRMPFPNFQDLSADGMTLGGESEAALAAIRDHCPNLRTITTTRGSGDWMEIKLTRLKDDGAVAKALDLIDERFRAVASLPEIMVELDEGNRTSPIRTEMRRRGWRIVELKPDSNGFWLFDDDWDEDQAENYFDINNHAILEEGGGQGG
jgi:hypothetical protein